MQTKKNGDARERLFAAAATLLSEAVPSSRARWSPVPGKSSSSQWSVGDLVEEVSVGESKPLRLLGPGRALALDDRPRTIGREIVGWMENRSAGWQIAYDAAWLAVRERRGSTC